MSYNNNNNPPGRCIIKNHYKYGTVYININKYNTHYIKTKNNDIVNSYDIPSGYDANKITLKDVITIMNNNNLRNFLDGRKIFFAFFVGLFSPIFFKYWSVKF